MCRMILAHGRFDRDQVLYAAALMSSGHTAEHGGPVRRHPDGWGMVSRAALEADLLVHRSTGFLANDWRNAPRPGVDPDFLVVHARHATLAATRGADYCHPVARSGPEQPWLLFHNGYLPTVYRRLGLLRSEFDSAELFDYLIPRVGFELDRGDVLSRLTALDPPGSAANAILVNAQRAYVLTWWFPDVAHPDYYRMFRADTSMATYVASERVPLLAPLDKWQPLERGMLMEFDYIPKED